MVAAAIAQATNDHTNQKAANVASVDADFQAYVVSLILAASKSPKSSFKKSTISAADATDSSSIPTADEKPPAMNLVSILGRIKK
jgi:hypothetical protein